MTVERQAILIDVAVKNALRDLLVAECEDWHIENYAENLRREHIPLCGEQASQLPFYDRILDRA